MSELTDRIDAEAGEFVGCGGSDAEEGGGGQGPDGRFEVSVSEFGDGIGFFVIGAKFCERAREADADGDGESEGGFDVFSNGVSEVQAREAESMGIGGEIEPAFIESQGFDAWREGFVEAADEVRVLNI